LDGLLADVHQHENLLVAVQTGPHQRDERLMVCLQHSLRGIGMKRWLGNADRQHAAIEPLIGPLAERCIPAANSSIPCSTSSAPAP
jgi:hypothetical protein